MVVEEISNVLAVKTTNIERDQYKNRNYGCVFASRVYLYVLYLKLMICIAFLSSDTFLTFVWVAVIDNRRIGKRSVIANLIISTYEISCLAERRVR